MPPPLVGIELTNLPKIRDAIYWYPAALAHPGLQSGPAKVSYLAPHASDFLNPQASLEAKGQLISKCPFGVMILTKIF